MTITHPRAQTTLRKKDYVLEVEEHTVRYVRGYSEMPVFRVEIDGHDTGQIVHYYKNRLIRVLIPVEKLSA